MTDGSEFVGLIQPIELAKYFTAVYRDPEVSNFERTQAASGLAVFWLGAELTQLRGGDDE